MNKVLTGALIFVGGAAVGGAVGWFVTKKKYDKTMDERIENEVGPSRGMYERFIEENKETIRKAEDILNREMKKEVESAVNEVEEAGRQAVESYTERLNRMKDDLLRPERTRYDASASRGVERTRYDLASKTVEETAPTPIEPDESEEKEVDEVLLRENDDNPQNDIYVITADQFAHERYGFDKVTLYWWELERILSEEDMSILDVPDILGYGWEGKIGTDEKDIVYVRNEHLETDYEVIVQHESFYAMRG